MNKVERFVQGDKRGRRERRKLTKKETILKVTKERTYAQKVVDKWRGNFMKTWNKIFGL